MHKESSPFCIAKDEETAEAMTKVIVERMTNSFMIEEGTNEDNRQPLINTLIIIIIIIIIIISDSNGLQQQALTSL